MYIEHAAGTMRGRDEVREWISRTMTQLSGQPHGRVPFAVVGDRRAHRADHLRTRQPDERPGDGSVITATNISIITYAGDGLWCRQEDIYNPLRFVRATLKWCRKAQALGTLDEDAARFMEQYGDAQ